MSDYLAQKIVKLFKSYIVKRPEGNCQILFALTELDALVAQIVQVAMSTCPYCWERSRSCQCWNDD